MWCHWWFAQNGDSQGPNGSGHLVKNMAWIVGEWAVNMWVNSSEWPVVHKHELCQLDPLTPAFDLNIIFVNIYKI